MRHVTGCFLPDDQRRNSSHTHGAAKLLPDLSSRTEPIGPGQNAYITGHHPMVLYQLPAGTSVAAGDTVTISTPASWMTCGTGNAANGVTNYQIGNRVGRSNMGTEGVTRTFKPGTNFSDGGSSPQTMYNLPANWRNKLSATNDGTIFAADGYPTRCTARLCKCSFFPSPVNNGLDATYTPTVGGQLLGHRR